MRKQRLFVLLILCHSSQVASNHNVVVKELSVFDLVSQYAMSPTVTNHDRTILRMNIKPVLFAGPEAPRTCEGLVCSFGASCVEVNGQAHCECPSPDCDEKNKTKVRLSDVFAA